MKTSSISQAEAIINTRHYKGAGVDVAAGQALVKSITPLASQTHRSGCLGELGGFGGLFDLKATGYKDPLLVAATDGVGTKLALAIDLKCHDTVGIDLVAMCVNDLVTQGAEPLFFLDYFACEQLQGQRETTLVAGIIEGCKQAGCALIGGETAEMPGFYKTGDYDLAGFALGAVEREMILQGQMIKQGDKVIGLASSGAHANGFSLLRQVIEETQSDLGAPAPFDSDQSSLGALLLTPTRIYVASCLAALRHLPRGNLRALAHITGGGLMENIPRILPQGMRARLDTNNWPLPALFRWLCQDQGIPPTEMAATFNCGLGMVAVVAPEAETSIKEIFQNSGERVFTIGEIEEEETPSTNAPLIIEGLDHWL